MLCLAKTMFLRLVFNYVLLLFQGKFIRINFDVAGYIVGANIETCILWLF